MSNVFAVAGATGNLGGRIVKALRGRGAEVRAVVRPTTEASRRQAIEETGAEVIPVDFNDAAAVRRSLADSFCVISALQGLSEVIINTQSQLLAGAIAAKVPRFIPSDYAADFTKLDEGENRNFDLRRAFHRILDAAPIASTSILNGAFMELLTYGMPLFDRKGSKVSYYGSPDQTLDFTTMDDSATFTAEAAMDIEAPRVLRIAGDQITARQLADLGQELTGTAFELVRLGGLDDLAAYIQRERAAHPETETEEFPRWQQAQYMHNMQSGRATLTPLDNDRYPDLRWTTVRELLSPARQ
jgi:nucleoside-diphosphate-sugar epimerase